METPHEEFVKFCAKCAKTKPLIDFGKESRKADGKKPHCKACAVIIGRKNYLRNREKRIASTTKWRSENPEKQREMSRLYRVRLKAKLISAYGGACTCCGESEPKFLTLEHLNGGGRKHRGSRPTTSVYREVINAGFPKHFTVLCMNCNFAKGLYGQCPHETQTRAAIRNATK